MARVPQEPVNFVKSALAVLRQVALQVPPEALALAAIVLAALVAGVLWIKARRAKAAKAVGDAAQPKASPVRRPPPDRLLEVWRAFLRALPAAYRRSILRFQPFVVLGAAGSGKSALVDRFTDWQRQSNQFLRSSVEDPNLQIYLASRALVFEVPATLLLDTSPNARDALLRLAKPIFRRRTPVVIVPVNITALTRAQPDAVRHLADTIRGKINLLSQIRGAPVEVRVALTHADEIRGFEQFARFAERHGLPTSLSLHGSAHPDAVRTALLDRFTELERFASLALTTLTADEYLEFTAFLQEAPRHLPVVGHFIAALGLSDSLSHTPRLERVLFTAATQELTTTSPFLVTEEPKQRLPDPLAKHRWTALGGAVAVSSTFVVGYFHESALWEPTRVVAEKYPNRLPPEQDNLRRKLRLFQGRHQTDALAPWLPSFFGHVDEQLDDLITDVTRQRTILPELERSLGSDLASRKSVYLLALLYATRANPLGALVRSNLDHWAQATGLDAALMTDYLAAARRPHDEPPPLTRLSPVMAPNATNDHQRWSLFFRRVARATAQGPISPAELAALQGEAEELALALATIERFENAATALKLTDEVAGFGVTRLYEPLMKEIRAHEMFGATRPTVLRFLELVRGGTLPVPSTELSLLAELVAQLSVLIDEQSNPDTEVFAIEVGDATHTFRAADWTASIRASAARELVLGYVRRAAQSGASIFFREDERGDAFLMNPRNDGSYLFTGKGALRAKYTRAAFDRDVRPVVTEFHNMRPRLGLAAEDLEVLDQLVAQAIEQYAAEYEEAIDAYYHAYGVRADSGESLQILIKQMLKPGSPFPELLRVVTANTRLDLDQARVPFFAPMTEALQRYASLHRALLEQEGGYSEIEKYKGILEQLLLSLRADGPAAVRASAAGTPGAAGSGSPTAGAASGMASVAPAATPASAAAGPAPVATGAGEVFTDHLSPSGRLALAILRGEPGSYRALVQDWVTSAGLAADLAKPFIAPLEQLERLGAREIESVLNEVWRRKVLVELIPISHTFPFDRGARSEASPEELQALLHPQTGRFHDLRRRYVEPVLGVVVGAGRPPAVRAPSGMMDVLKRVSNLSELLWSADGKTTPLRLRISSVPFASSDSKKGLLTLAYLSSGTSSMFNFNQQPTITSVELDWTRPQRAQLGIELMNPITGEKTYPTPQFADDSPWSLLRLLARGQPRGEEVAWTFQVGKGSDEVAVVRFRLHDNPWELFALHVEPDRHARAPLAKKP